MRPSPGPPTRRAPGHPHHGRSPSTTGPPPIGTTDGPAPSRRAPEASPAPSRRALRRARRRSRLTLGWWASSGSTTCSWPCRRVARTTPSPSTTGCWAWPTWPSRRTWPSAADAGSSRRRPRSTSASRPTSSRPARPTRRCWSTIWARWPGDSRPPASRCASEGGLDGLPPALRRRSLRQPHRAAAARRLIRPGPSICRSARPAGPRPQPCPPVVAAGPGGTVVEPHGAYGHPAGRRPPSSPHRPIAAPVPRGLAGDRRRDRRRRGARTRGREPIRVVAGGRDAIAGRREPAGHDGQPPGQADAHRPLRPSRRPRHLLRRPPWPGPGGQLLVGRVHPVPDRDAEPAAPAPAARRPRDLHRRRQRRRHAPGPLDRGHPRRRLPDRPRSHPAHHPRRRQRRAPHHPRGLAHRGGHLHPHRRRRHRPAPARQIDQVAR